MASTRLLEAALAYAKEGFSIFPVEEMGKSPRIAVKDGGRGCLDATTDETKIREWWTRFPNANVGLVPDASFFVLDVDQKEHDGMATLQMLQQQHGDLPSTLIQMSGSGGRHFLFKVPTGTYIKNSAGFLPGLDTRAERGYILVEPSLHPDGTEYRWLNRGVPIADAPHWLIELVKDNREGYKAPERSDTGSRDVDDASMAGYMHNGGLTKEDIFAALKSRNDDPNRRDVPLPDSDLWKTVNSITRLEVHTPKALAQATQENSNFDLNNLPSISLADIPAVDYLLDGLLVKSAVGMISGKFGSGKSMIVMSMAGAIAAGKPWAGLQTRQANVLYLDRENPVSVIKQRLEQMAIQDGGNFKVLSTYNFPGVPSSFDIELDSSAITRYVESNPNCLIIVDSLVGFLPAGASENDATHIRPFMNQARQWAGMGATVIILHHTGKGESSKDYRGSSDIPGSIDFGFKAVPEYGDNNKLTAITLELVKQRVLLHGAGSTFEFDSHSFTKSISQVKLPEKSDRDVMIGIMMSSPGLTGREFEAMTTNARISRTKAREFIETSQREGHITVRTGEKNRKSFYWRGPEARQDSLMEVTIQ